MTRRIIPACRPRSTAWFALSVLAAALILIGAVLLLGWDWLRWVNLVGLPRLLSDATGRSACCRHSLLFYFVVLIVARARDAVLSGVVWRSRSRGKRRDGYSCAAQFFLGLIVAETAAAVLARLDSSAAGDAASICRATTPGDEILIVVIGDSSALGVPYEGWLSVGAIVGASCEKRFRRAGSRSRSWPRKGQH